MDQVKQYLRVAAKYHFWILCGLVALLTLGSWYTTSASLKKQFVDNKGKITSAESSLTTVMGKQNHPNPNFHQQMDLLTNKYKDNLRVLWEKQYNEQGKNLRWPEQVLDDQGTILEPGLTREFVEQVEPLRPIETTVPYDPANKSLDKLKDNYKAEYVNYVKSIALPRLAKIVGSVWSPAQDSGTGPGGNTPRFDPGSGGIDATGPKEIVTWNGENQAFLQDTRFDWRKEVGGRPSTLQILYAQEDLWVLETIAKIIAKTNEGADAPHNAVVKRIEYLKLGRDAVGFSGEVMKLAALAGPAPGSAPGAPGALTPGQPLAPGAPPLDPRATPGAVALTRDPAEGRYVDQFYKAIAPDQLRSAFTSKDEKDAFLAVAKRMPVRMHLVVDQRKLHRFLAECGNSNLIVEVRQMRVNRPRFEGGPATGGATGGYPIAGGDPGRSGGGLGGLEGRGGGGGVRPAGGQFGRNGGGGTATGDDEKPHFDVEVELYGVVYIYNPVNEAMVTAVATGDAPAPTTPTTPETAPAVPAPGTNNNTTPAVPMGTNPPAPMNNTPAVPMNGETAPMPAVPAPMPMPMPMPGVPMPTPMPAEPMPATPPPAVPPANK